MVDAQPAPGEVAQPAAAPAPAAWWYLDAATKQNVGPVDAHALAGLLDAGTISVDTLVWAEGLAQWTPLKEQAELYSQVYYISASGASVPPGGQPQAPGAVQDAAGAATELAATSGGQARGRRGPEAAAKAAVVARPAQAADPALAAFQAEMAALGEADGSQAAAAQAEAGAGRAETPPPEDREFEDDDGTVYRWDARLRKFQPRGEAPAGAPEYGVEEMTFEATEEAVPAFEPPPESDESSSDSEAGDAPGPSDGASEGGRSSNGQAAAPEQPPLQQAGRGRKRGAEEVFERIAEKQKRAKAAAEQQQQWFDLKVNTSVYVTGLPADITEAQLAERFAQYGVVKPGDDGAPRVKLYRDRATGQAKGDGLVTFLYEPSVELACKLADEDLFRSDAGQRMRVQRAKFEMHGKEYVPKKKQGGGNKKKSSRERQKQTDKVLGWGGFDDKLKPTQITVILKGLFHPDDFAEQPGLLKELEADVKEECAKLGPVEKLRVFAGNPEGAAMVKFRTAGGAQACIGRMQGRFFGGRQLSAAPWDGYTNHNVKAQPESAEQQAARLERFSREIEAQGGAQAALAAQRAAEAGLAGGPAAAAGGGGEPDPAAPGGA